MNRCILEKKKLQKEIILWYKILNMIISDCNMKWVTLIENSCFEIWEQIIMQKMDENKDRVVHEEESTLGSL